MLIKNGKLFIDGQIVEKDLLIEDEKIVKIGKSDGEILDAKGLLILPGMTDIHVHLREPGETQKEDFYTGTRAALAGGITTVMDMPNNSIPTTTAERLDEKKKLAEKALCDVYFHFGATNNNFDEVKKANPDSLKIYMAKSTGDLTITDENVIKKHFENFDSEKRVFIHAEDQEIINKKDRSEKAALSAIEKIKRISNGRKIHIVHATTKDEIELCKTIENCTVETCPQYMFLSKKDEERLGQFGLVYPPLRDESQRKELWGALDKVDCIATDHAPHTKEEKEEGVRGMPGLETSLHLMLDAYNKRLLTMDWIISRMAEKPSEIYGLKLGRIKEGYYANLVFVDLKEEWIVKGEELQTKCKWSPFEGKKLKGKVKKTIFKGELKYEEGEFY